ncbi:MAG: transposase [Candidatus Doudnabacteria bacterium]|nr:transposase [Candidatus Doudnabacteria bacterium]
MRKPKYDRSERNKWYVQVEIKHKSVKDVCEIFGISRRCYYKWYLIDRALRRKFRTDLPKKNQPNTKLTKPVQNFIYFTKLKTNYGPEKMKRYVKKKLKLKVSTTIIYRFYKKKKLIRKPQKKQLWYQPMKQKLTITKPGEGVQMDVKYVYESGKRKYKFSVFDPFTKIYFFMIFSTKESKNSIGAFLAAEEYFGFEIHSVQTDNGSEARGEFHSWLTEQVIPHYFIPKKSPWWNANVERVHRTIDDEYYQNPHRVWRTPYQWLDFYNTERIHLTLGDLTPREKFQSVTIDC